MDELQTLYRVELQDGNGPFGLFALTALGKYKTANGYPPPINDKGIGREAYEREFCAVTDYAMLDYWFGDPEVLDILEGHNAQIVEYEVPRGQIVLGELQALFEKEEHAPRRRLPLETIRYYQQANGCQPRSEESPARPRRQNRKAIDRLTAPRCPF